MKVVVRVSPNVNIEVEEDNFTDAFEGVAKAQEVFSNGSCGCCKDKVAGTRFVVRMDKEDNKYYEMHCLNASCRARLPFGVAKKGGGMYPKIRWATLSEKEQENRKGEQAWSEAHGGYLPNGGWYKYVAPKTEN